MKIVNRDAMEAHLALQGWVPCTYGSIGARKGSIVWYMYRKTALDSNGNEQYEFGHSLLGGVGEKHDTDSWWWHDRLFWPFARYLQTDQVRIKTESVNGSALPI